VNPAEKVGFGPFSDRHAGLWRADRCGASARSARYATGAPGASARGATMAGGRLLQWAATRAPHRNTVPRFLHRWP